MAQVMTPPVLGESLRLQLFTLAAAEEAERQAEPEARAEAGLAVMLELPTPAAEEVATRPPEEPCMQAAQD